jgi:hypothetical protein
MPKGIGYGKRTAAARKSGVLPTQASATAQTRSHGKQGAVMKAAHAKGGRPGGDAITLPVERLRGKPTRRK